VPTEAKKATKAWEQGAAEEGGVADKVAVAVGEPMEAVGEPMEAMQLVATLEVPAARLVVVERNQPELAATVAEGCPEAAAVVVLVVAVEAVGTEEPEDCHRDVWEGSMATGALGATEVAREMWLVVLVVVVALAAVGRSPREELVVRVVELEGPSREPANMAVVVD